MKKIWIGLLCLILIGGVGVFAAKLFQKEEVTPSPEKEPGIKEIVKEEDLAVRLAKIKDKETLSAEDVYVLLKASNFIDETNKYEDDTKKYRDVKAFKRVLDVGSYLIFDFEGKKGDFESIEGDKSEFFLHEIERIDEENNEVIRKKNLVILARGNTRQMPNIRKILEKQAPLTEEELYESKEQKEMVLSFKHDDFLTFATKYFSYEQFVKEDHETLWRLTSLLDAKGKEIKGRVEKVEDKFITINISDPKKESNDKKDSKVDLKTSFFVQAEFKNELVPGAIKQGDEISIYAKFEHEGSQNKKLISSWQFNEAEVLTLNGKKVKKEKIEQAPKDISIQEKDQKRIREFIQNVQNKKKDKLVIIKPHEEKDIEITLTYTNQFYYKTNIGTFETEFVNTGPMDGPIYPTKSYVCGSISVESYLGYQEEEIPTEYISIRDCVGYTSGWGISFVSGDRIK